jgi:amino acid adenylation domain-containing protein
MTSPLHGWVDEAAQRSPESTAIVGEDGSLTYGELADYSDRHAALLREVGCRPGDRVALLQPRSARSIASLIGVLKAGCAYVPLDAAGGACRVAEMIRQCEPRSALFGGPCTGVLEALEIRGVLDGVERGWLDEGAAPFDAPAFTEADLATADPLGSRPDIGGDDLAYILFTSGTTGSPKGVPITHANVRAFIEWAVGYFELGSADRLSGHTALTFDLSTFDIYATFAARAQLHHVPKAVRMMPHQVGRFIDDRELTLWFSVPSQLSYVARIDGLEGRSLTSLRHVAWCGDLLPSANLCYRKRHLPNATFTNHYGPTETTEASSFHRVPADFDDPTADVPIGVGCAGEELLVLDDDQRPVAPGEVGEIYIRGVGVSPGYWRDPERTATAFLPVPGTNGNGERMYRTGDRGRLGADGSVSFLGRADFQIKTAGYRVEPAEVENAILLLGEVSACAVVPVEGDDVSGSVVGCAYVPRNGAPIRPSEVKKRLLDRIPPYMIPSRWLLLDELPVNDRGKVDRGRARTLMGG